MTYQPTATQTLFLWRLATAGGEDWKKDVKPDLPTAQRKALAAQGFIRERWEKDPRTKARGLVFTLEDGGWLWLKEHLDANLKSTSTAGGEILGRLLTRIKAFVEASGSDIADILCDPEAAVRALSPAPLGDPTASSPSAPADVASPHQNGASLPDRIHRAYRTFAAGDGERFVRLADLRAALSDVERATFDDTLWRMANEKQLALYPLNNPQELHADDQDAALYTPAGEPRHVVIFSP